ncbi:hypothetical protein I312_102919 [Cryptococcus bacillisporus CA1280]|uniref:Uncharacterized protein n=1 Tax=Cryptococcus bacillisporus CA1280 TaxID=1296109 RepID=A0A0D0VUG5_CRYGA|nr:hypothetical protein I312_00532 [Cryptococcus bacillisporus CA1280]
MKMFIPFSAIFTLIVLSASVSAKIYHVSVPDQASPGETITATLSSASFIENWDDFGVIWGLIREAQGCDGCVGQEIGYQNLYKDPSYPTQLGNVSFQVTIPDTTTGSYTFVAAVPHLVGISGETGINYFTQAIELVCKQ